MQSFKGHVYYRVYISKRTFGYVWYENQLLNFKVAHLVIHHSHHNVHILFSRAIIVCYGSCQCRLTWKVHTALPPNNNVTLIRYSLETLAWLQQKKTEASGCLEGEEIDILDLKCYSVPSKMVVLLAFTNACDHHETIRMDAFLGVLVAKGFKALHV